MERFPRFLLSVIASFAIDPTAAAQAQEPLEVPPGYMILGEADTPPPEGFRATGMTVSTDLKTQPGWSSRPLPQARYFFTAASLGTAIYYPGGFDWANIRTDAAVFRYDTATSIWSQSTPMLQARGGHAAVGLDGKLWVLGGGSYPTIDRLVASPGGRVPHGEYLRRMDVFDQETGRWTPSAPLNLPRANFAAVASGGVLLAIGGTVGVTGVTATVEAFEPAGGFWSFRASVPVALYWPSAVVVGSRIFLSGIDWVPPPAQPSQAFYEYDLAQDEWRELTPSPFLGGDQAVKLTVVNDEVYAFAYSHFSVYSPPQDAWSNGSTMPDAAHSALPVGIRGQAFVLSDRGIGATRRSELDVFDTGIRRLNVFVKE